MLNTQVSVLYSGFISALFCTLLKDPRRTPEVWHIYIYIPIYRIKKEVFPCSRLLSSTQSTVCAVSANAPDKCFSVRVWPSSRASCIRAFQAPPPANTRLQHCAHCLFSASLKIPPSRRIMSSRSFWSDACKTAFGKPLEDLLDLAYGSCGATVRRARAADCALLAAV